MKKIYNIFPILLIIFSLNITTTDAQTIPIAKDFAVLISAEVQKVPEPQITIKWERVEYAKQYIISRKMNNSQNWGIPLAILDSSERIYTDSDIEAGKTYEYRVISKSETTIQIGNNTGPFIFSATGYIYTGIEVPSPEFGKVLLLIDETMQSPLSVEIERLENDLISEGWSVVTEYVPRTEAFDGDAVVQVKNIIISENNEAPFNLQSIFILGRVAVPYSGDFRTDGTNAYPPDGHADHGGAWPSDIYYGLLNESVWTDITANDTIPSRDRNDNIPGDGKFDYTFLNQLNINVKLQVGRVDFYNLPAFEDTETELLRKYLNKNHAYRKGLMPIKRTGIVSSNISPKSMSYRESTASCGWRNFAPFFGVDNVSLVAKNDWVGALETDSYLFSYGSGFGGFTGVGGVVNTNNFASSQINAVFTMFFGSYSGDWDSQNNVIRAALASEPSILTCAWVGRPHWYLHHMALGQTIGYTEVLSQNNWDFYADCIYEQILSQQYPANYSFRFGNRQIHVALLGDPTLRLNMGEDIAGNPDGTPEPSNLSVVQLPNFQVQLYWEKPTGEIPVTFNVYESENPKEGFVKINDEPIVDAEFIADKKFDGEMFYMVRTSMLRENNSGSFYNLSSGIIQSVMLTNINDEKTFDFTSLIAPNPAKTHVNISLSINETALTSIEIFNMEGSLVRNLLSKEISKGTHEISWGLTDSNGRRVPAGIYFAKIKSQDNIKFMKIVVMP